MPHIVSKARRVGTVGTRSPVIPPRREGREGKKRSKRVPRAVCAASVRVASAVTKARSAEPHWLRFIRETLSPERQPPASGWGCRASACAARVGCDSSSLREQRGRQPRGVHRSQGSRYTLLFSCRRPPRVPRRGRPRVRGRAAGAPRARLRVAVDWRC